MAWGGREREDGKRKGIEGEYKVKRGGIRGMGKEREESEGDRGIRQEGGEEEREMGR